MRDTCPVPTAFSTLTRRKTQVAWALGKVGSKHSRGDPCTTLSPRQTQEADPQDPCLAPVLAVACV